MIEDLRRLESGAELEADLCIIGAGAAGIAIAREFLGSQMKVVVAESGGLRQTAEADSLNEAESTGIERDSLRAARVRVLGGATSVWGGQCLRPEPDTFVERPWIPHSGWPFDRERLEPFHRRAEGLFGIDDEVYDERVWDRFGVDRPAMDPRVLYHRFSVWCPRPHLGRLFRSRLAESENVTVLLNATATQIVTNPAGDVFDSVRVATPEGATGTVRGRACVVCAGGIENARLLLASAGVHKAGIGNSNDVVGRYFQDHPNLQPALIEGGGVARMQELYGLLYRGRVRYLPRLVMSPQRQRSESVMSCAANPVFEFGERSGIEAARRVYRAVRGRRRPEGLTRDVGRMAREAPRLVPIAYRRIAHGRASRTSPHSVVLHLHAEQAPNPDSRVTLSRRRDPLGMPLPKVDWRLTELDRRTAEVMVRAVAEELGRLGLGEVHEEAWLRGSDWRANVTDSFHHMGTTRMGSDPRTSVVDPNGQVHGVGGLFVAGSSVFPASGFVNPTLLIVALALRLADHLDDVLSPRAPLRLA